MKITLNLAIVAVAMTFTSLAAAAAHVNCTWTDYPAAELIMSATEKNGTDLPSLEPVNSHNWAKIDGLGAICHAGNTPEGFTDVVLTLAGDFPYVTKGGETNRYSLSYVVDKIAKDETYSGEADMPLRCIAKPDGGYDYIPYGTSGGMQDRLGYFQFGGVLANGEFEKKPSLVFRTKTEDGIAFGRRLADAANRLGVEQLLKFGQYPVCVKLPEKAAPDRKFVYAHAMQCFLIGGIPEGFAHSYPTGVKSEDFETWPPHAGPEVRTWWSERLEGLVHKPALEAARADLDCAEKAGLDAMGILIYPGCLSDDNPWHGGIERICAAAENHSVKILFDLWGTFPPSWSRERKLIYGREHGKKLKKLFDRYPKAWLKVNGKIAFQFGRDQVEWNQHADDYMTFWDSLGGRENYYLICTQMDSRGHNFLNGWEGYGDMSTFWCVHCGWGDKSVACVLDPIRRDRGDRLAWGVSRGYYRASFGGRSDAGNLTEGFGACRFTDNWREAIERDCGAVYVQSWNDMGEDHHILESNFLGDSFLQLNGYFSEWFKTGHEPEVKEEKIFMFHRRHLVDAKFDSHPGREPQHPSWASAPLCDYVHIVTMLKSPGSVELELGENALKLENVGTGLKEWLVLVPKEKDHHGNNPYWNTGSYEKTLPFDTDYRKVTNVTAIPGCTPVARVVRDGKTVFDVKSRTGIADHFRFHCFNVIGSVGSKHKGDASLGQKGNASLGHKGNASLGHKGNASLEQKGDAPLEQKGNAPLEQKGGAPLEQKGNAPLEQKGDAPLEQKGNAPLEQKGNAPLEQKGNAPLEQKGEMVE